MAIGRSDEHGPGRKEIAFLRFLDRQQGTPGQDIRNQAAMARVEVLHHDNGGRKTERQGRQHLTDGRQPARRRRQRHNFERRLSVFRGSRSAACLHGRLVKRKIETCV
jgi:hypothetical protein